MKYDTDRTEEGRMNKRRNVDRKGRPKEERNKEGRKEGRKNRSE